MRNYIILNGVNSNTITGLLISTLSPITKPKQRTQIEEIDGRDGDIVTKLGYSAYEKSIQIGLYGDFDINEVIAYFNTEGTVTFSNEPDKYYNYQILDQIDYEKLIRFKTANVKMHVQPFKYPLEETPVEITIQNVTGSGENIDLDNTAEAPLTLALKGNTSQDGTPTPSAPIPVETVTGGQEIKLVGKNILPQNKYIATTTTNGIAYTNNGDGTFNLVGTASANTTIQIIPIGELELEANQPYYLYSSVPYNSSTFNMSVAMTDNGSSKFVLANNTYTPTATPTNERLQFYIASGQSVNQTNIKMMLIKGNTAPSQYEPYKGASYPINLGDIELCKLGDYQDRIYKDNGKWYIEKQIGKVVLNGTQNITLATSGTRRFNANYTTLGISNIKDGTSNVETANYRINSHFQYNSSNTNWGNYYMYSNWLVLFDANSVIASANDLKTWFANNLTSIYYVLATPTTTEITDTELIGQLEAIKTARSYDPITHISQNTANKPFILNATAVQKGTDTGIVDNEGNIYSKPTIDIEGSGTVEIYLDGNQMFSVDLSNANECIIDTASLEAYNPSTSALMNRQVTGDYSNFKLNAGDNEVKISGTVTKATISNYTRWL